jgi:hypothetical protein
MADTQYTLSELQAKVNTASDNLLIWDAKLIEIEKNIGNASNEMVSGPCKWKPGGTGTRYQGVVRAADHGASDNALPSKSKCNELRSIYFSNIALRSSTATQVALYKSEVNLLSVKLEQLKSTLSTQADVAVTSQSAKAISAGITQKNLITAAIVVFSLVVVYFGIKFIWR